MIFRFFPRSQLEHAPATNSLSKESNDDGEEDRKYEIRIRSEVEAFEGAFQTIQDDYTRSVGSEKSKEDYKRRMKVVFLFYLPRFRKETKRVVN